MTAAVVDGGHVVAAVVGAAVALPIGIMWYWGMFRREQETTKFLSANSIGDEKMPLERILRKNAERVDEFGGEDFFPPTVYEELEKL